MQRGFSLLEVLVAFVILALVATALFGLFGGALGNAGVAEDVSRAVLIARAGSTPRAASCAAARRRGTEEDRYEWTTRIEPWEAAKPRRREPPASPVADADAALPDHRAGQVSGRRRDASARRATSSVRLARREGAP